MAVSRENVNKAIDLLGIPVEGCKEITISVGWVSVTHYAHDSTGRRLRDERTGNFPLATAVYQIEEDLEDDDPENG